MKHDQHHKEFANSQLRPLTRSEILVGFAGAILLTLFLCWVFVFAFLSLQRGITSITELQFVTALIGR